MSSEVTVQQLMDAMPKAFMPEKAQGVNSVVQYHLTGAEGGDWVIRIQNGACTVEKGTTPNPNLTLTADSNDYKDVITGKANAMNSFMQGKLKLQGDLGLAMKLIGFFRM
jgi:putative sterol carrier protein